MKKKDINIKDLFAPGDSLAYVVIIVGLLIAILLDNLAFILIGISIMVIGIVGLFWLISNRVSGNVRPIPKPSIPIMRAKKEEPVIIKSFGPDADEVPDEPEPETKIKTATAARPTRFVTREKPARPEDNNEAEDNEQANVENESVKYYTEAPDKFEENSAEGFRIVSKDDEVKAVDDSFSPATDVPDESAGEFDFEDDFSGVRVVGKSTETTPEDKELKERREKEIAQRKEKIRQKFAEAVMSRQGATPGAQKPEESQADQKITLRKYEGQEANGKVVRHSAMPAMQLALDAEITKEVTAKETHAESSLEKQYSKKQIDVPLTLLMEQEPFPGQEPRREFDYFLKRALKIIRSAIDSNSALFLLVNKERNELILEVFETDLEGAINGKRKFRIGNDIVSQVAKTQKPEILTEINPKAELDIIPYYKKPFGTNSFIGVPAFFNDSIVGVLCADSDKKDAFDATTVAYFGQFTKFISAIVDSYTGKYDLMQESRTLKAVNLFRKIMSNRNLNIEDIYESVLEAVGKLFEFKGAGVCAYDEASGGWTVKKYQSRIEGRDLSGREVGLENTLIGKSLLKCDTVYIANLKKDNVRLYNDEDKFESGYFVAVPLKSFSNNYGALFLEGKNPANMTEYDKSLLETLGEHAGTAIEQMYFIEMLQSSALIDTSTGIYNPPAFFTRLDEEISRIADTGIPCSLCLLNIDKYSAIESDDDNDRKERVLYHVLNITGKLLRKFDIIGKIDNDTFGIILPGMKTQDAQLWAEKLRGRVAKTHIEIFSQKFNVTLSLGIAQIDPKDSVESLSANARKALALSIKKTNSVHAI